MAKQLSLKLLVNLHYCHHHITTCVPSISQCRGPYHLLAQCATIAFSTDL